MITVYNERGKSVGKYTGTLTEHEGYFEITDDLGNENLFPENYRWHDTIDSDLSDEALFCLSFLFAAIWFTVLIILIIL